MVVELARDDPALPRLRERQLGGQPGTQADLGLQVGLRLSKCFQRRHVLEVEPQHLGEGVEEGALPFEEGTFRRRRAFLQVADLHAPLFTSQRSEARRLHPLRGAEGRRPDIQVSEEDPCAGDFGILPGRRELPDHIRHQVPKRSRLVLEDPDGLLKRGELLCALAEATSRLLVCRALIQAGDLRAR